MSERLRLNNGTVLENSSAILSGDLFLYMHGYGMKEIFDLLIEPETVKKIVYVQANGSTVTFTKYKKLIAVRDEGGDLITAVLRKEVNG